jgi:hypothetical protein
MRYPLLAVAAVALAACSTPPPPAESTAQSAAQSAPTSATITTTSKSPEAIAHFQRGEVFLDNARTTEAAEAFA